VVDFENLGARQSVHSQLSAASGGAITPAGAAVAAESMPWLSETPVDLPRLEPGRDERSLSHGDRPGPSPALGEAAEDGWHWHPAGADLDTSPDMLLAGSEVSMAEAKRRAVELFLRLRQRDGLLPLVYNCAV
jgi:hypothetical protein